MIAAPGRVHRTVTADRETERQRDRETERQRDRETSKVPPVARLKEPLRAA